jgi:hypothetical protein
LIPRESPRYRSATKEITMSIIGLITGVFVIGVPALLLADTLETGAAGSNDHSEPQA